VSRAHRPVAGLAVIMLLASGCGGEGGKSEAEKKREAGFEKAADASTCLADAKPADLEAVSSGYPTDFPLPDGAVAFNAEDRGQDGVIVTAVTDKSLKSVLGTLNGTAQDAGFKVTSGETEKHDAEANWEGNGFRGRWAIKESAKCEGEVVIQVLSKKES
jgi:hypothetical protein